MEKEISKTIKARLSMNEEAVLKLILSMTQKDLDTFILEKGNQPIGIIKDLKIEVLE